MAKAPNISSKRITEAEHWLVRLQSPNLSDEEEKAFFVWLQQSEAHQYAYLLAEKNWARGDVLAQVSSKQPAKPTVAPWSNLVNPWGGFAVAALLLVAVMFVAPPLFDAQPEPQFFQTQVGEQREVELADGSTVFLNTSSLIEVVFSKAHRTVYLKHGEVFFKVSKDSKRPFDVITEAGQVRVLGTEFAVKATEKNTTVTVLEGVVGVDQQSEKTGVFRSDLTLHKNEQVNVEEAEALDAPRAVDASMQLDWRNKKLVFKGDKLDVVVKEINRYFTQKIHLGDELLKQQEVVAVFQVTAFENVVSTLERSLNLDVQWSENGDSVVLFSKP